MEFLTNVRWLIQRKMPNITKTSFVIIFFMFIPYLPLLIITHDIATPMSVAQYNVSTESAMMMGVILFIISAMFLWMYGKFWWKEL